MDQANKLDNSERLIFGDFMGGIEESFAPGFSSSDDNSVRLSASHAVCP